MFEFVYDPHPNFELFVTTDLKSLILFITDSICVFLRGLDMDLGNDLYLGNPSRFLFGEEKKAPPTWEAW